MSGESPVVELYDSDGNPFAIQNGASIPVNTPTLIIAGSDGTNARYLAIDSSGRQIIVGAGTAGTPTGGVVSIQGVSGGQNVPISGTVTANAGSGNFAVVQATAANLNATVTANGNFNNASVSGTAAAPPASATYIGGSVTTSSPTYTTGQMNALSLTTAGALRIDGSAVTQPISGTVTANAGTGTFTVAGTVTANQGTSPWVTNITQFGGSNIVTGTGTGGAGIPRVTVSNDSNILATQSGTWTVAQGSPNTIGNSWPVEMTDGTNILGTATHPVRIDPTGTTTQPVSGTVTSNQGTSPWVTNITQFGSNNVVTGTGAGGVGIPRVTISNDSNILATQSGTWTVQQGTPPWTVSQATAANLNATTVDAQTAESTAAWTSSTTVNTALQLNVSGYGTVAVTLNQGTTITGGVVTFEVSDTSGGTNWYPIAVIPTTANVPSSTYTLVASTNASFQTAVAGFVLFRVRLSTVISGTGTVNVGIAANASSVEGQSASYITDGTHGPVAVKPANTAAVAADPALVVTISPDSASLTVSVSNTPSNSTPTIVYGDVSLNTITTSAVERTNYTEQSSNFTGSVVSSSASDTSAGTGARQIKITFVDSTGATAGTETATLNGTTAVNLVTTTKCFIEKIEVTSVGSTGNNVGTISLFTGAAGAGTLVGTIGSTDNKTFWAHHYVVTGKTFNLTSFIAGSTQSVAANGSSWVLKAKTIGVATAVETQINDTITLYGQSSQVTRNYTTAIPVATGPARVRAYVTTLASASATYRGAFDFYEA